MKLNAIIVEDEKNARDILKNYLVKYCSQVTLVGEAATIEQGLLLINEQQIDLVFLDVEMPYGTGFDFLEKTQDQSFETVFVTAYDHYAIEALNAQATYYLLKPINIEELVKGVNHVIEIKEKENNLQNKILTPKNIITQDKITIPLQNGFEVLKVNDILYCLADDNYTHIYLKNKKKLVSKTLKYFEELLGNSGFARVHKSYLVNVQAIVEYKKGKGGSIVLENGKEIIVSPTKKKELLNYFN